MFNSGNKIHWDEDDSRHIKFEQFKTCHLYLKLATDPHVETQLRLICFLLFKYFSLKLHEYQL